MQESSRTSPGIYVVLRKILSETLKQEKKHNQHFRILRLDVGNIHNAGT